MWVYGNIFWGVLGTPPNRELVVEWRDVAAICDYPATITFETVFFENSDNVLFNYRDMITGWDYWGNNCSEYDNGAGASSGIQVARNIATQYSYNEPLLQSQTAILWTIGTPAPRIIEILPFNSLVGDPGIELNVFGRGFLPSSVIQWNGSARTTMFLDSGLLHASIPAGDLASAGEVQITVVTPDGGTSAARTLTIFDSYPLPVISQTQPAEFAAGTPGAWIYVTGSNFLSQSVLRLNGQARQTEAIGPTELSALLPAPDLAQPANLSVTVVNPAPGGGPSNEYILPVKLPPVPVLSGVTPTEIPGGSNDNLDLTGSGFIHARSLAQLDGDPMGTYVTDSSHMSTLVPNSVPPGTHQLTVYTPPPGGGTSGAITVRVTSFVVAASPAQATVKAGQSATFAITVTPYGGAFDNNVSFGCAGLAAGMSCSFMPPNGTLHLSPLNTTLTVNTPSTLTARGARRNSTMYLAWCAAALLFGGALILPNMRRRGAAMLLMLMASLALYACGGGGGDGGGDGGGGGGGGMTYAITVEASSGLLKRSVQIFLTVQP